MAASCFGVSLALCACCVVDGDVLAGFRVCLVKCVSKIGGKFDGGFDDGRR